MLRGASGDPGLINCKHSHLLDSDIPRLVTPRIICAHLTRDRIKLSFEWQSTDQAQARTAWTAAEVETTGLSPGSNPEAWFSVEALQAIIGSTCGVHAEKL